MDSLSGGDDGEHTDVSFLNTSDVFASQDAYFVIRTIRWSLNNTCRLLDHFLESTISPPML